MNRFYPTYLIYLISYLPDLSCLSCLSYLSSLPCLPSLPLHYPALAFLNLSNITVCYLTLPYPILSYLAPC